MSDPRFREFDTLSDYLPALCADLLERQRRSWPRLREGYESLAAVQTRRVSCRGFEVTLQFNPGRIVSTTADVDAAAITARPCFLCREHLPPEQEGILVDSEFLVLANPAPIFSRHFTVSHRDHRRQSIEEGLEFFLDLARWVSPEFTVFYNGPKCGASAPDHLHVQMCPTGAIPIEQEVGRTARKRMETGGVAVFTLEKIGRSALVLEGTKRQGMQDAVRRLLRSMRGTESGEEPMVNILCSWYETKWKLIVFPRSRHRPAAYSAGGNERVVVSPASVDMGGLIITPVERDFKTLDGPRVESIYEEVSLPEAEVELLLERFRDLG